MSLNCGYRFFECSCGKTWKEKCRDAETESSSCCPDTECPSYLTGGIWPIGNEKHPEWKTDMFGNLIEPNLFVGPEPWEKPAPDGNDGEGV